MGTVSTIFRTLLDNYPLVLVFFSALTFVVTLNKNRWEKKIKKLGFQPQLDLKEKGLVDLIPCRNNRNTGKIEAWTNLTNTGDIATKLFIKGKNGLATYMDPVFPTVAKNEKPLVIRIRVEKSSQNKEYPLLLFFMDKSGVYWKQTVIFQKTNEQDKDRFKPIFLDTKVDHFGRIRYLIHKKMVLGRWW